MKIKNFALALALGASLLPLTGFAKAPAGAQVERIAPDRLRISWEKDGAVDVYVADRPDATTEAARLVSSADRDGRHELTVAADTRPYFILRDRKDGQSTRVAERLVPLRQGSNFRDIGGYPAANGKHVRWGMIYRSGGTPVLTEGDLDIIDQLKLANLVDLRSSDERQLAPTRIEGVPYHAVGYSMTVIAQAMQPQAGEMLRNGGALYRHMPKMLVPQVRLLFRQLLAGDGPVAFNCSAGQDRTGFATAMILSALGVPREVIIEDYHLSTRYRNPRFEAGPFDPAAFPNNAAALMFVKYQGSSNAPREAEPLTEADGTAFLTFALDEIDQRYGSVEAYLDKEIGVSAADIATLQAIYLE